VALLCRRTLQELPAVCRRTGQPPLSGSAMSSTSAPMPNTSRTTQVRVRRSERPAAPQPLDLRTPSGRALPY
jgi:hypothetical protein